MQDRNEIPGASKGAPPEPGLYLAMFQTAPQGIVVHGADGTILTANSAAERFLGLSLEQMRGMASTDPRWQSIHEDGSPFPGETHPAMVALHTGKPVEKVVMGVFNPSLARTLWIEVNAIPVFRDGEARPGHVYTTFVDISERKKAEHFLRTSEEKFAKIFRLSPDAIDLTRTVDGVSQDLNNSYTRMFGYTPEEFLGRSTLPGDLGIWVNKEDRDRHIAGLKGAGEVIGFEAPLRRKDGSTFIAQISSSALEVDGESCNITITRDISERKQAETALRASEEKFSRAFHASPDSININRLADGVYLAVNEGFTRITGYTAEDVLGRSSLPGDLGLWVNVEDRRRLQEDLHRDGIVQGLEAPFRRKDGTVLTGLMSATLIDVQGEPCLLSITRDITERIRAEEEKARLKTQLQQAQTLERLGTLAGGVAHDMNNVLGAILGIASASIEAHDVGSNSHMAFDTIIRAAQRGGKMVKSLLNLGHRNSNQEQQLDLNAILCDEVQLLESTTLSKVHLQMNLLPGLWPIRGEAGAFNRAFMNLLVNAVDAMPDTGLLSIRTCNVDDHWVEVQVEDTGTGMAKEVLEKAMDPFFTTKPMGKGTGIGLSMVYDTVKAHRGQIEIQSEPGRGTLVRMRFPACEVATLAAAPSEPPRAGSTSPVLNVLLIDDDELVQHSTQALLGRLGHRVNPALSGEEALARLEAGYQPDVVILDMNMPGLGGKGTLPRLRALNPGVPVLIATGRIESAALELAQAYPHVTLLAKPYSIGDLQRHLEIAYAPMWSMIKSD